jgi:hypothetical protein
MPTPTYTPLANITLGSSASSVTFSSIPATFRDLVLVSSVIHTGAGGNQMRVNGDTGSNYPFVQMLGDGSATTANSGTLSYFTPFTNSNPGTTSPVLGITEFIDYSATDKHKTMLMTNSSHGTTQSPMVAKIAARWANTAAITTILIYPVSTTMAAGSTFALYGIAG